MNYRDEFRIDQENYRDVVKIVRESNLDVFRIVKKGISKLPESQLQQFIDLLAPRGCNPEKADAVQDFIREVFVVGRGGHRKRIAKLAEKQPFESNP